MATIDELKADLEALQKARRSGALQVTYSDGKSVRYRSYEMMKRAEKDIADDIDDLEGRTRKRVLRVSAGKGL